MIIVNPDDYQNLNQELAATIGFFDGVHRGHRFLIDELKQVAQGSNLPTAVITFREHPQKTVRNHFRPQLLTSCPEKMELLSQLGIDYCILLHFDQRMADLTAEQFMRDYLKNRFHVQKLLLGFNHSFGKDKNLSLDNYVRYGQQLGIEVYLASEFTDEDCRFSSTAIRTALGEGNVREAANLLSYNYSIQGTVVHGDGLAATFGFPTANIQVDDPDKLIPKAGVYVANAYLQTEKYPAMLYLGARPTIEQSDEFRIEAHLLGYSGNCYNQPIRVELIDRLRDEIRFDDFSQLQSQLLQDREETCRHLML